MPAPLAVRRGVPARRAEISEAFDPRQGKTGRWLGADSARSIPLNDSQQRTLWLFADTWNRIDGGTGTPTTRNGAAISSDSLAIQTGPDLTSATVTFHRATTPTSRWFYVSPTHFSWPMDGLLIGDDLYVMSQRVLMSNPLGAEYGWVIHKVPNARTTPVETWASTLLHQSGDTGTRPIWSPYDGGDGYIYSFTIKRHVGWLWSRWTVANFTGAGTQGAVQFYAGGGTGGSGGLGVQALGTSPLGTGEIGEVGDPVWSSNEADAVVIAANPDTAEGSVHRMADGRWAITDSVGTFPLLNGQVKVSATSSLASGFTVAATHTNPRHANPGLLPPDYHTYAYKAHPQMPGEGLVVSYVDNAAGAPDLSIYWPKFVRLAV